MPSDRLGIAGVLTPSERNGESPCSDRPSSQLPENRQEIISEEGFIWRFRKDPRTCHAQLPHRSGLKCLKEQTRVKGGGGGDEGRVRREAAACTEGPARRPRGRSIAGRRHGAGSLRYQTRRRFTETLRNPRSLKGQGQTAPQELEFGGASRQASSVTLEGGANVQISSSSGL